MKSLQQSHANVARRKAHRVDAEAWLAVTYSMTSLSRVDSYNSILRLDWIRSWFSCTSLSDDCRASEKYKWVPAFHCTNQWTFMIRLFVADLRKYTLSSLSFMRNEVTSMVLKHFSKSWWNLLFTFSKKGWRGGIGRRQCVHGLSWIRALTLPFLTAVHLYRVIYRAGEYSIVETFYLIFHCICHVRMRLTTGTTTIRAWRARQTLSAEWPWHLTSPKNHLDHLQLTRPAHFIIGV